VLQKLQDQMRLSSACSTEASESSERPLTEEISRWRAQLHGLKLSDRPLATMLSHRPTPKWETYPVNKEFLATRHVTPKMRSKVVRWMNSLCDQLELLPVSAFHAVAILDHYLSIRDEEVKCLQLAAATCVYISSKLNDTRIFSAEVFTYSASGLFTDQQLHDKEVEVLQTIEFRMVHVNPCRVLKRIAQVDGLTPEQLSHAITIARMGLESLTVQHTPLLDVLSVIIAHVE
jgi:hypothetical protein